MAVAAEVVEGEVAVEAEAEAEVVEVAVEAEAEEAARPEWAASRPPYQESGYS